MREPDFKGERKLTRYAPLLLVLTALIASAAVTRAQQPASLANISTRMRVEQGDNALIGGFIITGTAPKKIILRAIGPTLGIAGVPGALQDPTLELFQGGTALGFNDNWKDAAERAEIEASTIAVGSSRVDLQACKLEYSIVSPK